jgi:hypothetical protein
LLWLRVNPPVATGEEPREVWCGDSDLSSPVTAFTYEAFDVGVSTFSSFFVVLTIVRTSVAKL